MVYMVYTHFYRIPPKNPENYWKTENLVIFGQISNLKIAIVGNPDELASQKFHRTYPKSASNLYLRQKVVGMEEKGPLADERRRK